MYLLVVAAMLVIVFMRTGFELQEPASQVAGSIVQWLALGLIDTQPPVNGYEARHVLAGVTWTIFYEWMFYASLLLTAGFARGRRHLRFVGAALVVCLAGKVFMQVHAMGIAVLFLCGMAVASLLHEKLRLPVSDRAASGLCVACLALLFWMSRGAYGTANALLLALLFYLVCSGASLFGLLGSMPARRLGNISYSLYLMQGLVLTVVFAIEPIRTAALANAQAHWAAGGICVCLLLVCASLGYVYVERPGISLGKRLGARIDRRRTRQAERGAALGAGDIPA
jgi:peptidoglycan/LPS O-acetylase OafA/YrhL